MARIIILGATGSLGMHVTEQATVANHEVSVLVRTPAKLPAEVRERVTVHQADIAAMSTAELATFARDQDTLINAAGHVSEGQRFVTLVDHIVTSVETLAVSERPVCWFLAGAALLDIGASSRRGIDLPAIAATYWPHVANFRRLQSASLDWRLLCPGPMVEGPPVGFTRLRVSLDRLPVDLPEGSEALPDPALVALFTERMPEMILPYADAAALMLNHLEPGDAMARHRVGLALPAGMRGEQAGLSPGPTTKATG